MKLDFSICAARRAARAGQRERRAGARARDRSARARGRAIGARRTASTNLVDAPAQRLDAAHLVAGRHEHLGHLCVGARAARVGAAVRRGGAARAACAERGSERGHGHALSKECFSLQSPPE